MALAILVVDRDTAVQQLAEFGGAEGLVDFDREQGLDLVEDEPAVAVGTGDQRLARLARDRQRPAFEGFGAAHELVERFMVEPAQDQHLATRQERGVQFEARILGGRTDQRYRAVLDIGQEAVLLRSVEAMHLVDEQQGLLAGLGHLPGLGEDFLEIGNAREDRRDRHEPQPDGVGEQPRDAGLARARRPPQDHRGETTRRDHPADRALGAGQMLLADDLVERPRPEAVGERRIGRRRFGRLCRDVLVGEQVWHCAGKIGKARRIARSCLLQMQLRYILDTSKESLCHDIIMVAARADGSRSTSPRA